MLYLNALLGIRKIKRTNNYKRQGVDRYLEIQSQGVEKSKGPIIIKGLIWFLPVLGIVIF